MSEDMPQIQPEPKPARIRGWQAVDPRLVWREISWPRVAAYCASIVAALALLTGAALMSVNSDPGRKWLVGFVNSMALPSGLKVHIGRIDGSLYGDLTLYDVSVSDPKGVFVASPQIHLNWRPFEYLNKHVEIHDLSSPRITMSRLPELAPGPAQPPSKRPILPDLKVDLDTLRVDRIELGAGVAGPDARVLTLKASAHLLHRKADINAAIASDKNDDVTLIVAAVPDQDRLDVNGHIHAPTGGVITNLLHLSKPLDVALAGQGGWKNWVGGFDANFGPDNLAKLRLTETSGTFHVTGVTRPDLLIGGQSIALLKPQVAVDTTVTLHDNRNLDIVTALSSPAFAINAKGQVDLGANRFNHVDVQAKLLRPETIDKTFTGQDIHADLRLDGGFYAPRIDYDVAASRFGLGKMVLTGLKAEGHSHYDNTTLTLPIKASMTSLTGIDDHVDALLTHVSLDGQVMLKGNRLDSNSLHLKSDRVDAHAKVTGDIGASTYQASIDGKLDGYHVDQVGTLNLGTHAKLAYAPKGGFNVGGDFTADSTHWDNDSLDKVLGGNAHLTGSYGLGRDGAFNLTKLAGQAPDFKLLAGAFSLKNNAVTANASAQSTQYGPLLLTVGGTLDRPTAVLKAASPGLGMQISNVVLNVAGQADSSYALTAAGDSAYGPFSADTLLMLSNPMTVDVHKASFAGVNLAGRLQQTAHGPFAGTLTLNGSGLTGTATLADMNGDQGAAINASGSDVAIPNSGLKIGRTLIAATAVLRKEIEVNADVQAAQLVYADTILNTGRAKLVLHGDRGTLQAVLHGEKQYPFDVAVNADIQPAVLTVAMKGTANSVAFSLPQPARFVKNGDEWDLNPTTLATDGGRMQIAGHIGTQMKLQMRMDKLDLGIVNIFAPDAGIGGQASGAVDFYSANGSFPTARANLRIDDFTRSSVATVSTPVSMVLDASLNPDHSPQSNYVRAVFREGATDVGHLQLTLRPGTGDDWTKQVLASDISGGVRYNGPSGLPFSLGGLARQSLSGAIAIAADISGKADAPQLTGAVRADNLTYDNESFGTRVTSIALEGRFSNDKLELTKFSGAAGTGTVKGSGWLSLSAKDHFPMQVHADLDRARLASSDQVNSTVSGSIDVVNNQAQGAVISGDLRLPNLRYVVTRQGAAEVSQLDGVHHKGFVVAQAAPDDGNGAPSKFKLDLKVRAANSIFVQGMGLDSEWSMNLHVVGTTDDPSVLGEMKTVRGRYSFAGRDFTIDNGTITFNGGQLTDPQIALTASADLNDIKGAITVTGSAQRPDIAFSSTPALPQDEVLSRMLFGTSITNLSATEALQLASAVNGLRGGSNLNPLGALRSATGIDRLSIVGADTTTGRGTSLAAGKYLTNNVYVEIVTDTKGFTATQLEVALSRTLSVLSQTGGVNGTQVSVKYSKDY